MYPVLIEEQCSLVVLRSLDILKIVHVIVGVLTNIVGVSLQLHKFSHISFFLQNRIAMLLFSIKSVTPCLSSFSSSQSIIICKFAFRVWSHIRKTEGLQTFWSESHITHNTTIQGPEILCNEIASGYVAIYQINKFLRK